MRLWDILRSRVRSVLLPHRREDDLAEELRLHLERQAEEWMAKGVDPVEARSRARRQFGNVESLKEESREARGTAAFDGLMRDTRHAARRLLRDWRFSAGAVLILALGLGANTAIFTIVNATLLRESRLADPERLVEIYQNGPGGAPGAASYPTYLDIAAYPGIFSQTTAVSMPDDLSYRDRGRGRSNAVRSAVAEFTTASYPAVLGLRPSLGRWFTADEERAGASVVAVIGHQTWMARFNADRSVIGRTILVEGVPVTIVGVGPAGYRGTVNLGLYTDFWLPVATAPALTGRPRMLDRRVPEAQFFVKARLREGVTVDQVKAAMAALGRRLAADYPDEDYGTGITVMESGAVRIHPQFDGLLAAIASLVLGVMALVLAIACSNLATLQLVRATARAKEVAVRLAIGATRWQVVRHLLTESLLLSVTGGAVGCLLAWWLVRAVSAIELPVSLDLSLDTAVLAYAVALSVVTGVLFGLAPALKSIRLDLVTAIRQDSQPGVSGRRWFTLRNGLVVFQVTASVVLLAATGAFLQMVIAARAQRIGFAVDGVAMLATDMRFGGYSGGRAEEALEDLRRRVAGLPGVQAAALIRGEVMSPIGRSLVIEGRTTSDQSVVPAGQIWAGAGFFEALQIPILLGRALDERDRPGSPAAAVATETMARQYFGTVNAVGRRFRIEDDSQWIEIVGVVRDTGTDDRGGDLVDPVPHLFFRPFRQAGLLPTTVLARTSLDAGALVGAMRRELLAIDPDLPVMDATTMAADLERSLLAPQAVAGFPGSLGALGLLLSGIGLYAVVAFAVSRRAREIGVRMALGARSADVVRDVLCDVGVVLGAGACAGLAVAALMILAMRAFANPAPGIAFYRPGINPLQLLAIVGFIVLVGLAAAIVPARRAAKMNPLTALRHE